MEKGISKELNYHHWSNIGWAFGEINYFAMGFQFIFVIRDGAPNKVSFNSALKGMAVGILGYLAVFSLLPYLYWGPKVTDQIIFMMLDSGNVYTLTLGVVLVYAVCMIFYFPAFVVVIMESIGQIPVSFFGF
jgi:hypothetical protein